jgi:hypothetical protein
MPKRAWWLCALLLAIVVSAASYWSYREYQADIDIYGNLQMGSYPGDVQALIGRPADEQLEVCGPVMFRWNLRVGVVTAAFDQRGLVDKYYATCKRGFAAGSGARPHDYIGTRPRGSRVPVGAQD